MDRATRELVRRRAGGQCEYCRRHQRHSPLVSHQVEHIIPKKHGGTDDPRNLALACASCNLHKGPNLAGLDPDTASLSELFHPRTDAWADHFRRDGAWIRGLTPQGRATITVLNMNSPEQIRLRTLLDDEWDR